MTVMNLKTADQTNCDCILGMHFMSQSIPTGYIPPGQPPGLAQKIARGVRI